MLIGFFAFVMSFTGLFLIMLVLIQRGKGGGLVGALGGMGGSSALGTKASDAFTWVTIGAATVWILSCIITLKLVSSNTGPVADLGDGPAVSAPVERGSGTSDESEATTGTGDAATSGGSSPALDASTEGTALPAADSTEESTETTPPAE
jgi:preprotein translocase subunit SecG